jgi:D-galactarolactone cycloisomerase
MIRSVHEFAKMFDAGAVTYAQPSVTKVGGITEFLKVVELARTERIMVMPHSPYFGPGFLATLHLAAALTPDGLVERFYVDAEAQFHADYVDPIGNVFRIPQDPGLGSDPDPDVIKDYRVSRTD